MITIPVCQLEIDEAGHTLWVHSPCGATVLRLKSFKGFTFDNNCANVVSHADITVPGPVHICLAKDAQQDDTIPEGSS